MTTPALPTYVKRLFFAGLCFVAGTLLPAAAFAGDPWLQDAKLIASDGDANHHFGQAVALSGDTALVSRQDPASGPLSESRVYVLVFDSENWIEQTTLFPDDHPVACSGGEEDQCPFFGWSVAVDGDVAVVGAPTDTNTLCDSSDPKVCNDPQPGAAYIFVRDGDAWSQQAKLMASGDPSEDHFGQSVAIWGDTVLIGAPTAEVDGHAKQGSAYVFVFDGQDWIEQERLTPAIDFPVDPCSDTTCPFFGNSVALLGDTALVGAANMQVDGNNQQGAAYVFTRDAGVWTEQTMLIAAEGDADYRFGSAVALSEGVALVGAPTATIDFGAQGAVFIFTRDGSIWSEQDRLLASDATLFQHFGEAVVLVDSTALVGATDEIFGGNGATYMFTIEDDAWIQQIKLTAADGAAGDRFGNAVALSGGVAMVGAVDAEISGNSNQGATYVFVSDPILTFDPDNLDFGQVELGAISSPQTTTLSNTGGSDATGLSFNTPGNGFTVDSVDCGNTLAAGGSCGVSVTFTPVATGAAGATLTAGSDQMISTDLVLAGEGIDPAQLSFSPSSLDFGDVEVGTTSTPLDAELTNPGDSDATGLNFSVPSSGFSVVDNECGTTLVAGQSCMLSLTFAPASSGSAGDMLTVEGDSELSASLTLSGNGAVPPEPGILDVTPTTLDFGEVLVGAEDTLVATVSNAADAGAESLTLSGIEFDNDVEIALILNGCNINTQLLPGESCTFEFLFSPGDIGSYSAVLSIATADGQDATINVLGAGVEVPDTSSWIQQAKLLASDGQVLDRFGNKVALSGDTALIAATWQNADSPIDLSKAYIYEREGETWSEQAILEPLEADGSPVACVVQSNSFFRCPYFGWSVAIEGDLAIVGAPWSRANGRIDNDGFDQGPGSVYVFERESGQWTRQAVLTASDSTPEDQFGFSVDVSGDTILVGARKTAFDGVRGQGAAYVFVREGGDWVEQARLQPVPDGDWPHPYDCTGEGLNLPCTQFGQSVALEGDTAIVGAYGLEVGGERLEGAVYVFTREQGTWSQQPRLTVDHDDCRDHSGDTGHCQFGMSVALSDNTALVVASAARVGAVPLAGAAYVFIHDDGSWSRQAKLTVPHGDTNPGDIIYGYGTDDGVALEGDVALVGAQYIQPSGPDGDEGTAYLYKREGAIWGEPQRLTTPRHDNQINSRFGYSAALSGATALIGAWSYDYDPDIHPGTNEGGGYVFVDSDADLLFTPASLNFGTVEVSQSGVSQVVTLRNRGEKHLTGLTFSDPGNGFVTETADCDTVLPAGASCEISVTFTPATSGPVNATLQVESDEGAAASLILRGNGNGGGPQLDMIFKDHFEQEVP